MSRTNNRRTDDTPADSPTTTDSDTQLAREQFALGSMDTGSSGKLKGDRPVLSPNLTDGDRDDLATLTNTNTATQLRDVENSSVENGDGVSVVYKVYKRRWFGLVQLTLLNIIVSWDVSCQSLSISSLVGSHMPPVLFYLPFLTSRSCLSNM